VQNISEWQSEDNTTVVNWLKFATAYHTSVMYADVYM